MNTPAGERGSPGGTREDVGDVLGTAELHLHSVWGRVVPDIPAFCRELVAALAEG